MPGLHTVLVILTKILMLTESYSEVDGSRTTGNKEWMMEELFFKPSRSRQAVRAADSLTILCCCTKKKKKQTKDVKAFAL